MSDSDSPTRPTVLIILDGWGLSNARDDNAVALAATPTFDRLCAEAPMARLTTHGPAVGLPEGQMGNSEVGHMNLGAGRVVWMDLPKIDRAIEAGDLAQRPALRRHIDRIKSADGVVHLLGLASPGGVHAHQRHILALARIASEAGLPVRLHLMLDGRDTAPKSALGYLREIEEGLVGLEGVEIATVIGRFYAMDRDKRWDRVEAAYHAIVNGVGRPAPNALTAIERAYAAEESDEFVTPTVIGDYEGVLPVDGVLMANFRADRAREILAAIGDPNFDGFERQFVDPADLCGMVSYSDAHDRYMSAIFPKEKIVDPLGAWVAAHGLGQFRVAETEKYPHVTFFFNGGVETPSEGEARHLAPSPKVRTYDLQPEMSAPEVADALVRAIESGDYGLIVCNFANPDMVGHTGDLQAAIRAVEAVDGELSRALAAVDRVGGAAIVTADHGNCEQMRDPLTGGPHTAHTTNPVPIFLVGGPQGARLTDGVLGDVAPTLLALMGLPKPEAMTGESLLSVEALEQSV